MKNIPLNPSPLLVGLLSLASCGPSSQSDLKESPDLSNRAQIGDIDLSYSTIEGTKSFKTDRYPWSDTYWPDTEKSLFRRWGALSSVEASADLGGKVGIAALLETHIKASAQKRLPLNLSPSEKYDIIFRYRHGRQWDQNLADARIKAIGVLEKEIDGTEDVPEKRTKAASLLNTMFSQDDATGNMDRNLPMSYRSLYSFVSSNSNTSYKFLNTLGEGEDWSWTGLCHGWAPAALFEAAPKQHVRVTMDQKELILTKGDIRGLLTKSWADHSPYQKQFFVGRRCNEDVQDPQSPGPVDPKDRGYSGELTVDGKALRFNVIRDYVMDDLMARSQAEDQEYLLYLVELQEPRGVQKLLFTATGGRHPNRYKAAYLFDSLNQFRKTLLDGGTFGPQLNVKFFGCWDTNPAILHQAVVSKLGSEKMGFVMDRTQGGQVWNQPVHEATTLVGALVPVSQLGFDRLKHLTPGTQSVAQVTLKLQWLSEPYQPAMSPDQSDDADLNQETTYQYLLEFDRNRKVIGGEWGNLKTARPSKQVIPDFLYGFEKDAKPNDAIDEGFDYTGIISQIHQCSLKETTDSEVSFGEATFKVVNCEIKKM